MQEVWVFFRILEIILGITCIGFHIYGFVSPEPLPHNLFYCGTFSGYVIISLFATVSVFAGYSYGLHMEAIISLSGSFMHFIASLLSMKDAEEDYHLMYLTVFEEPYHPFFGSCRRQSITALALSALYLMHGIFAVDSIWIRGDGEIVDDKLEGYLLAKYYPEPRPIELYIFGKTLHKKLMEIKWFKRLADLDNKENQEKIEVGK